MRTDYIGTWKKLSSLTQITQFKAFICLFYYKPVISKAVRKLIAECIFLSIIVPSCIWWVLETNAKTGYEISLHMEVWWKFGPVKHSMLLPLEILLPKCLIPSFMVKLHWEMICGSDSELHHQDNLTVLLAFDIWGDTSFQAFSQIKKETCDDYHRNETVSKEKSVS